MNEGLNHLIDSLKNASKALIEHSNYGTLEYILGDNINNAIQAYEILKEST